MKRTKTISTTVTLMFACVAANAAHVWNEPRSWAKGARGYDHESVPLYSANEFSMDLGAGYLAGQRGVDRLFNTSIKDGNWGGDVGLNYFVTREVGIGVDVNMPDNGGNLVDAVLGNLIVRLPIGKSGFAPYLFGGGGRTTGPAWEWMGQAGLGTEFRLNHTVGLYADGRYLWQHNGGDGLLLRTGIRLVF